MNALKKDYSAMREMYLIEPPPFDQVIEGLRSLELEVNRNA
jgi:hypothetical protein